MLHFRLERRKLHKKKLLIFLQYYDSKRERRYQHTSLVEIEETKIRIPSSRGKHTNVCIEVNSISEETGKITPIFSHKLDEDGFNTACSCLRYDSVNSFHY